MEKKDRLPVLRSKKGLNQKLQSVLQQIDEKLSTLGVDPNHLNQASANFKYNELDSNTINIQTSVDTVYLMKSLGLMLRVEEDYNKAAEFAGIKTYPVCKWLGVPVSAWIHDLKYHVKRSANAVLINQLIQEKQRLSVFLSEDQRLFEALKGVSTLLQS